jgi:hypothetical protein
MKTTDREKAIRLMKTSREKAIRLAASLFEQDQAAGTLHENGEDAMCIWYQAIRQAEGDDAVEPFREHRQEMEKAYDRLLFLKHKQDCMDTEEHRKAAESAFMKIACTVEDDHPAFMKIALERGETSEHVHNVHEAVSTEERPFTECVRPYDCEGAAHGGITLIEACLCGASRRVNVNGHHGESGPWRMPETSEDATDDYLDVIIRLAWNHDHWTVEGLIADGSSKPLGSHKRMAQALAVGLEYIETRGSLVWVIDIIAGAKTISLRPADFETEVKP